MFLVSLCKGLGNGKSIQAPACSSVHLKDCLYFKWEYFAGFKGSQNYLEGRYEEMRIKAFWSVLASETKNEFCHLIFFLRHEMEMLAEFRLLWCWDEENVYGNEQGENA